MTLAALWEQLDEIEQQVADAYVLAHPDEPRPSVHPFKTPTAPGFPAIYNVIPDAPHNPTVDTAHVEDLVQVAVRCAVRHTSLAHEQMQVLRLADVFMATVDPALRQRTALTVSRNPLRRGMRWATDQWPSPAGDVRALCVEFRLEIPLRRRIARHPQP